MSKINELSNFLVEKHGIKHPENILNDIGSFFQNQDQTVQIGLYDFQMMLLHSFRYSLGRRTYVSSITSDWLIKYWNILPVSYQEQIQNDIKQAIDQDRAGDSCDIESWNKILNLEIGKTK